MAQSESAPLLGDARPASSVTFDPSSYNSTSASNGNGHGHGHGSGNGNGEYYDDDAEDDGIDKGREVEVWKPGKSTFSQTLLNALGDLIGTGLLANPIAIAHAGWVFGPLLLILMGAVTLWTLKILLRIIEKDRRLRSFTDVIGYALGPRGEAFITAIFVIEVCTWIVALVVLFSDSLEAVFPQFTSNEWKMIGLVVIVPLSFMPLRWLSFSSALGVTSSWTLVGILLFSGIATEHTPGSLREPAPTDLLPAHGLIKFISVFGLMSVGFGGHGLIPNLIHDMKNPKQADRVCELAYGISMVVYLVVAVCGYIMYGRDVSDEVSKDLARTPGFSPMLNKLAVLMVALNPLTKIPLGLRPLATIIFTHLNLHSTVLIPQDAQTPHATTVANSPASSADALSDMGAGGDTEIDEEAIAAAAAAASHISIAAEIKHDRRERFKRILRPTIRVLLSVIFVFIALIMPSFESVLSFIGALFAISTMIIIPVWAGASVFGWRWYYILAVVVGGIITVAGTVTSVWSPSKAS